MSSISKTEDCIGSLNRVSPIIQVFHIILFSVLAKCWKFGHLKEEHQKYKNIVTKYTYLLYNHDFGLEVVDSQI